jgi:hypothetical protein
MLDGVDTPRIVIPFLITIDNACKKANLELFESPLSFINLNSLLSFPKFQYA